MQGIGKNIGIVYLNRKAEGELPVRRFIDSFKSFKSGINHDFITIYKGFSDIELDAAKPLFNGIESRHIIVDDEMTDIDSYLIAAETFSDIDLFCFVNTFTEIVCENWLFLLYNAITKDNVGIVGATVSFESLLNSCKLISKVVWLCSNGLINYDKKLYLQYKTIIDKHCPNWIKDNITSQLVSKVRFPEREHSNFKQFDNKFEEFWSILTKDDGVYSFLNGYPAFPNPHIRSNGFMVRRIHLLPFFGKNQRMSKKESYLFESGANGLTRQILNNGLKPVCVNSYGNIFDIADWSKSKTFRLENQEGLLIHDNQTRNFQSCNWAEKNTYGKMTWGRSSDLFSENTFTFGIPF